MPGFEHFISQTFRAPNPAEADRARYGNALMRNEVARVPQQNRAQDAAIQRVELGNGEMQKQNAAGILGRNFAIAANSPRPREAMRAFLASPDFVQAGKAVGLPVEQFTITDQDTDDGIRQQAQSWADVLSGRQQSRVQSTQVLEDGTIALVGSDGTITRTNEKARNDQRFVQVGGGTGAFDPRTGNINPITSATQENAAAADKTGAEAWARAAATAGVDLQKEQAGRQGTLGIWRVARKGLLDGLAGTDTGPVAGRMPAFTVGQQVAEGAVAAVAPVLKALFRSAGEGTFTDRDQQLLTDMIPNRNDHPQTIVSKMQMIDAIIEAKLSGQSGGTGNGPQVGEVQDGYQFIGGDPSQQTSWRKVR